MFPYDYAITLTAAEYRSARVMSDRGYLGEIVAHASHEEWSEDASTVTLCFAESDAQRVCETVNADPGAVWALTSPGTPLGTKFVAFFERIV